MNQNQTVTLIGNVGTKKAMDKVIFLSVAVNGKKNGEDHTQWINTKGFGPLVKSIDSKVNVGDKLIINGEIIQDQNHDIDIVIQNWRKIPNPASGSVNRVLITGRLGADAKTFNGNGVYKASLAVSSVWKKKDGEFRERTVWIPLTFFPNGNIKPMELLKKGNQFFVEGRFNTSKYEKDGENRYSSEIIVERFQLIGNGKSSAH